MNNMNYDDFKNYIKDHIGEYLSEDYKDAEMKFIPIKKSNGVEYDSLNISKPSDGTPAVIPQLNLTSAYESYQKGDTPEKILDKLADLRMNAPIPGGITKDMFLKFDNVRDRIFPRLVNSVAQAEYLANKPHKEVADLAMLYAVRVHQDEQGIAEAVIDNDLLDMWNADLEDLNKAAMDNIEKQEPVFMNLESALFGALSGQEDSPEIEDINVDDYSMPFFLLTNKQKVKGATMVMNDKVMDRITDKLGDIYVLPSSVDEVIVVPKSMAGDPEMLANMVKQVNEDAVRPEDRLSDNIYEYNSQTQSLCVVGGNPVQGNDMGMKM